MGVKATSKSEWVICIALAIVVVIVGVEAFLPKLGLGPGYPRQAPTLSIVVNLRNLDGAIQVWALDHGVTNVTAEPRWDDLLPYLSHRQKPKPEAGEHYVLGRLCDGPHAVLTREWLKYPKGTIMRVATNGAVEFWNPTN